MKQCRVRAQPVSGMREVALNGGWCHICSGLWALGKKPGPPLLGDAESSQELPSGPMGKAAILAVGILLPPGNVLCGPDKEVVLKTLSQTVGTAGAHF